MAGNSGGPVLYVDVAGLFYGLLNYVLLAVTARLCLLRPSGWRLLSAALLGGCLETLALLALLPGPARWLFWLALLQLGLGPRDLRGWLSCAAVFGLLNIILTGAVFWLFFAGIFPGSGGVPLWGAGCLLLVVLGRLVLRCLPGLTRRAVAVEVEIELAGRHIRCGGFVDTGNTLRDPVDGAPVIVMHRKLLAEALAGENGGPEGLFTGPLTARFRVIPYRAVGQSHGLLPGLRADRVTVAGAFGEKHRTGVVIALTEDAVPECLVPAALL